MSTLTEDRQLVVGLGNEFRGDDAFGIVVVQQLVESFPDLAEYILEQNDLTRLLDRWEDRKVIIVDALFAPNPKPGQIHQARSLEEISFINTKQYSSHGVDLLQLNALAETINRLPKEVYIIGVEGSSWEMGSNMGPQMAEAIPEVIQLVLARIDTE